MARKESLPPTRWLWSIVLVLALHLLSTAGTWWITDHGEILAVAAGFLEHGRLDLKDLGPGWEDWERIVAARPTADTRFLPLSILSLTPFLLIDHALGLRAPGALKVVHLQGHFFVALALVIAGRFISRIAGTRAAALGVLLLGLNWPVWMIARRLGPEPLLLALVAGFMSGGALARFFCLALLPWVHASGPLLAVGALAWLVVREGSIDARALRPAAGCILGVLSLALLWNLPVHGHLVLGGYDQYASDRFFTPRHPVVGVAGFAGALLAWTLPLAWLTARGGKRVTIETLALFLPAVVFFGVFSSPEPARRLAPLVAGWVILLMTRAAPVSARTAGALSLVSLASAVIGLSRDFVTLVETPFGVYAGPHLLFMRMAFLDGHPWFAAGSVALLVGTAVVAARRVFGLLAEPTWGVGSNHAPGPELKA